MDENRNKKSSELEPVNQQRTQLDQDNQDLNALLKDARSRVAQEKYLGITLTPEGRTSDNTEAKTD